MGQLKKKNARRWSTAAKTIAARSEAMQRVFLAFRGGDEAAAVAMPGVIG